MIRIHSIKVPIKESIDLKKEVSKKLRIDKKLIKEVKIHKRSIDARSIDKFSYVMDLDVIVDNEEKYLNNFITKVIDEEYKLPEMGIEKLEEPPVVVGAGPAGLFCAYELAKAGFKPLVIERGEKIEDRFKTVEKFWHTGEFNKNSNVQFGEGGAGTFSDGKLNTLVKDKENRMKEVFSTFVKCGAPEEIMYDYHPHIGTDILRDVVVNLRKKIETYGGTILYNSLLEDIIIKDNKVDEIVVNGKKLKTSILVLAIGHSARDTFRLLERRGLNMISKPFAIGVRIMHPQSLINENQYPISYPFLPAASYKLTYKASNGHGVYSFCMCPGGFVVDARSKHDGVVVNGMSNYKRDSGIANSAIVVTVNSKDFGSSLWAGVEFQEKLERKAWKIGHGFIPGQKYSDFKENIVGKIDDVDGVKGKVTAANLNMLFPKFINDSLKEGIDYFGTKIKGFNDDDVVLLAPESRTSSPIRIIRDENLESNILGIYPAGEGAGYAGGITTSAIDGIKIAEKIIAKYHN